MSHSPSWNPCALSLSSPRTPKRQTFLRYYVQIHVEPPQRAALRYMYIVVQMMTTFQRPKLQSRNEDAIVTEQ